MRNLIIVLALGAWYASDHPASSFPEFMSNAKGSIASFRESVAPKVSGVIVAYREPVKQAIVAGVVDLRDGISEELKNGNSR